jgi:hypothetical protein
MDTRGRAGSLIRMACGALHFDSFGRMRKVLDVGMAVGAAENSVDAGRVFGGIN